MEKNCDGMWENYWYCIGAYASGSASLPQPSTVTARPSPIPTGQPNDCASWYLSAVSDSCELIAIRFGSFSEADFIKWNPSVGRSCDSIVDGLYYCVGILGTPTTRTSPLPTVSAAPTESPMQSGIAKSCTEYWLVMRYVASMVSAYIRGVGNTNLPIALIPASLLKTPTRSQRANSSPGTLLSELRLAIILRPTSTFAWAWKKVRLPPAIL